MIIGDRISQSSSASDGRMNAQARKRGGGAGYTPGHPVTETTATKRRKRTARRTEKNFNHLPDDVLEKILMRLANERQGMSVILMSMVNRDMKERVLQNLKVWHMLYLHWRGHLSSGGAALSGQAQPTRMIRSPQGQILRLNPTVPRTLPNFQNKSPSLG